MKKYLKNIFNRISILFLILITLLSGFSVPVSAFADDTAIPVNEFDFTDPIADLSGDENFNIENYPYKDGADLKVASFNEYCYSFYSERKSNFSIYIYVYNPSALAIVDSSLNRVQMAVGYDGEGKPSDYEKFELKLCSVSEGDYSRLFYKFKVIDHLVNGLTIYDRLNSHKRRYDVSGIELISGDSVNAVEKDVKKTYYFTGYAAGYGPDFSSTESTLKCDYEDLETVELNVKHTFWRSKTSNKGEGYQNQLDTVYFSIPNRLLREYGKLQRIKAEWYEYKTKDIVVTSNQSFYNAAKNYIGREVNRSILPWCLDQDLNNAMNVGNPTVMWSYNEVNVVGPIYKVLYYLFPTKNWTSISNYDPYSNVEEIGGVSSNDLYNYILNYDKTFESGTVKDGQISADLFESDIDDYRKIDNEYGKIDYGYSYYDFDADVDLFDLMSYSPSDHSFAENRAMYGFWSALFGSYPEQENSFVDVSPILILDKDEYLSGTNQDVSDRLLVNYNDVNSIKTAVQSANDNDETVVLFRFAVSDYYSVNIDIWEDGAGFLGVFNEKYTDQAYRAKESVFLDFDIIQLTFNNDGETTVIPVVSDPIDVVDDVTPPYNPPKANIILAWLVLIGACIGAFILLRLSFKFGGIILNSNMASIFKLWLIAFILAILFTVGYLVTPLVIKTITDLGGLGF